MTPRKTGLLLALAAGLLLLLLGCEGSAKSSAGFRLPDGDAARGLQVVADLKCYVCHRVEGGAARADRRSSCARGPRRRDRNVKTDGVLVTSIIQSRARE